ncbi:MAG: CHAT domain-containing protein [Cyanobacteria bacterium P01_F01_bin.116]
MGSCQNKRQFMGCFLVGLLTVLSLFIIQANPAKGQNTWTVSAEFSKGLRQGQVLYETGRLAEAAALLEGLRTHPQSPFADATLLSNLALVYGQQGQWNAANQAITQSLDKIKDQTQGQVLLAQTLDVRGRLEFGQRQSDQAMQSWQQAAEIYAQLGEQQQSVLTQIRQANALQSLGFHRKAQDEILLPLYTTLSQAPASLEKAVALRYLATAYQTLESLDKAQQTANESLTIAKQIEAPATIEAAHLKLGNIIAAQAKEALNLQQVRRTTDLTDQALGQYQQVVNRQASSPDSFNNHLRAQLNQLSLLVDTGRWNEAKTLWPGLLAQMTAQQPQRDAVYGQLKLAESLIRLHEKSPKFAPSPNLIRQFLTTTESAAIALGDQRAKAYVAGYLGTLYLNLGQLPQAQQYTEQGLFLAQTVHATEITYRWYAQLGKIDQIRGDRRGAIANYEGAVHTLKTLRSDLVHINPQIQFSFQKSVEPIHRQLISLLLDPDAGVPSQTNIKQARDAIESLREEELNDFLRAACLDADDNEVTYNIKGTEDTAFIHTIILDDRLELIAKLPGQDSLFNYSKAVDKKTLDKTAQTLRTHIGTAYYSNSPIFRTSAQALYQDIFTAQRKDGQSTFIADLTKQQTKSLLFVLDGSLRSIPISVLYDQTQKQYVLEQFQVAISPGLKLLNARPREATINFDALTFGLSESRQGFKALPNVQSEVNTICTLVNCDVQFNEAFTRDQFLTRASQSSAPVVHLATHGQFGSKLNETFILAWDKNLTISDFNQWLRARRPRRENTELLVLSACETALGDDRTTLGLAGVAVRAGANSTLASLWKVDDRMTSLMVPKFYEALAQPGTTKAEALQIAQRYIVENYPQYKHPYFWSAFILVGSWL